MSYDSSNLTTPDIKWLGVRPSDLDRFNIPEQCRLPMTEEDLKTGKRLVRFLSLYQALVAWYGPVNCFMLVAIICMGELRGLLPCGSAFYLSVVNHLILINAICAQWGACQYAEWLNNRASFCRWRRTS